MTGLECRNLRVCAGGRTLVDVEDLRIPSGECLAVLGPNGAGKSTLLRAIGFLSGHQVSGQILLDGTPVRAADMRSLVAAVLQRPILRRGTVAHNMSSGLRFRGVGRDEARHRIQPWIETLGLKALVDRDVRTLSGGEAQRVSLARALVLEPRVLLLDEPFGALDTPTRADLLADLRNALDHLSTITLLVTHDRHEALALSGRTALLVNGRIRQIGPSAEVFEAPVDAATAALCGFSNRFPPTGARPARVARPEHCRAVRLDRRSAGAAAIAGTVRRVIPLGVGTRVDVDVASAIVTCLHPQTTGESTALETGDAVLVQVLESRELA